MDKDKAPLSRQDKNRKVARYMFLTVLGMFLFAFALVPLYNLACKIGGINGIASDTGRVLVSDTNNVDTQRWVTIQFDSTVNTGLPWDFYPEVRSMKVHPGQKYVMNYIAQNNADHEITGQAIPGVTPWQATKSLHKIECFCFTQQTLKAGEKKVMPLHFVVAPELEKEYETMTLSYTFMNIDRKTERKSTVNKYASVVINQR
jgi:cytochrome c oxidase assembly protein subunit 11